jgi:hypothetical protein
LRSANPGLGPNPKWIIEKEKENNQQKSNPKKQPTDFPFFFAGRTPSAVDMPPHVGTRNWLWGKGHLKIKNKKNKKQGGVGRLFLGGIAFFCLFCKILLRLILTPPARYQHPHDTSNPPVGRWGNCGPKWWPQGSSFSSSKTKQRKHKAERGELNGLVVYVDVRIGLTLYSSSCSTRCELNLFFGGNKKNPLKKTKKLIVSQRHHISCKWIIRGN